VRYLRKGSKVLVEGSGLRASAYLDGAGKPQASLELNADRLIFLDSAPEAGAAMRRERLCGLPLPVAGSHGRDAQPSAFRCIMSSSKRVAASGIEALPGDRCRCTLLPCTALLA
jgi:single-stranded DNA-binding protein